MKVFLLRFGTRQECPFSPLLLNIALDILANVIKQEKENIYIIYFYNIYNILYIIFLGNIYNRKREWARRNITAFIHIDVHRWCDCLCTKYKRTHKNLPELVSQCGKFAGYKVNFVSIFQYKQLEYEILKILFIIAPPKVKYIGIILSINLTKYVPNVCACPSIGEWIF